MKKQSKTFVTIAVRLQVCPRCAALRFGDPEWRWENCMECAQADRPLDAGLVDAGVQKIKIRVTRKMMKMLDSLIVSDDANRTLPRLRGRRG